MYIVSTVCKDTEKDNGTERQSTTSAESSTGKWNQTDANIEHNINRIRGQQNVRLLVPAGRGVHIPAQQPEALLECVPVLENDRVYYDESNDEIAICGAATNTMHTSIDTNAQKNFSANALPKSTMNEADEQQLLL